MGCGASTSQVYAAPPGGDCSTSAGSAVVTHPSGPLPLLQRAVSLRWLCDQMHEQALAQSAPQQQQQQQPVDWMWSNSEEAVDNYIRPATAERQCSYAETLDRRHVGKADYFVSYSWRAQQVIYILSDILQRLFPGQIAETMTSAQIVPDCFVWIDIFAVPQHPGSGQQQALAHLGDVIRDSKHGTLLLYGIQGVPLTRIWCLYEMWQTALLRGASALQLCTSINVLELGMFELFKGLDLGQAEATVEADKERILAAISASQVSKAEVEFSIRECVAAGCGDGFVKHLWDAVRVDAKLVTKNALVQLRLCFDVHLLLEDMRALQQQSGGLQQPSVPVRLPWKPLAMESDAARMAHPHFAAVRTSLLQRVTSALPKLVSYRIKDSRAGWAALQRVSPLLRAHSAERGCLSRCACDPSEESPDQFQYCGGGPGGISL